MKKLKYLLFILILCIVNIVKAEQTLVTLDCGNNELVSNASLSCNLNLTYSELTISNVTFSYDTEYSLEFDNKDGYFNSSNNNMTISFDSPLSSDTEKKITLGKIIVKKGNVSKTGSNLLKLKNIRVNTPNTSLSLDDINKNISYISSEDAYVDCTLKNIKIGKEEIKNFSPTKYNYLGLTSNSRVVFIDALRTDSKTSVTGLGNVFLRDDSITVHVNVSVSESSGYQCKDSDKTYTLVISYKDDVDEVVLADSESETLSDDNTLSIIELYNGKDKINFDYDNKKTKFDVKVGDIEKITIKATLNDSKAKFVSKYGPRDVKLDYGKNTFSIKVNSESNKLKTYTLNIEREDTRNTDSSLLSLKINEQEITLVKDKYEYEIEVLNSEVKTNVLYTSNSDKAKVTYEDIELLEGDNELLITVTAENGSKSEYKIKIKRLTIMEEEARKHYLESINVEGYSLNFNKDITSYDLTVKNDVDSLIINVLPEDDIATTILGNGNLENGSKINIKVIDDGGEKNYTINIHKEKNTLDIICYSVFALGIIIFITSIIYYKKKSK